MTSAPARPLPGAEALAGAPSMLALRKDSSKKEAAPSSSIHELAASDPSCASSVCAKKKIVKKKGEWGGESGVREEMH